MITSFIISFIILFTRKLGLCCFNKELYNVSKYIDSANNNSTNFGQEYLKYYKSNPNCFKRILEHCGTFGDLFMQYKNIVDRPFIKKKQ